MKAMSPLVKWISRVPETIKEAKQLIEKTSINEMEESDLDGYRFKEFVSSYGGVEQKWLVIFSEKGYDKEMATLIKNIKEERMKMDGNEALREYKDQQSVERGFRFLKDPLFSTSSVFLKKPSRIVSLGMIMVLSLLVYSVAQFKLRKALKENDETIPDQKGKAISRPTMRWVFQIFEGIHLLVESGGVLAIL